MAVTVIAGRLETFSPMHLIRLVQAARVTGRLEFANASQRVDLFIEDGTSVLCTSSGGGLQLGELLVRHGDLREEVVELALALQSDEPGKRIGRILVESGSVTEEQVQHALATAQRQILCEVLLWREGTFQFFEGEIATRREDVRIELDVDRLVAGLLTFAGTALSHLRDQEAA